MELFKLLPELEANDDETLVLEALGDLVLYTDARAAAERHDETLNEYAAAAIRRFAALANERDWLDLSGRINRAEDPSKTAFQRILAWSLAHDMDATDA